jgi:hypothetical protein
LKGQPYGEISKNCPGEPIFLEEIISLSGAHPGTKEHKSRSNNLWSGEEKREYRYI